MLIFQGTLNGAGASTFGLASDISGSIRLPSLFCGVFGHKPTGGLISVKGHYPYSTKEEDFPYYLQMGPITRFAKDLPLLLQVMAGENAKKLKLTEEIDFQKLKVRVLTIRLTEKLKIEKNIFSDLLYLLNGKFSTCSGRF